MIVGSLALPTSVLLIIFVFSEIRLFLHTGFLYMSCCVYFFPMPGLNAFLYLECSWGSSLGVVTELDVQLCEL